MNRACQYNRANSHLRDVSSLSGGNSGRNEMHFSDPSCYSVRFIWERGQNCSSRNLSFRERWCNLRREQWLEQDAAGSRLTLKWSLNLLVFFYQVFAFFFWGGEWGEWGGHGGVRGLHSRFFFQFPSLFLLPFLGPFFKNCIYVVVVAGGIGILSPWGSFPSIHDAKIILFLIFSSAFVHDDFCAWSFYFNVENSF